MLFSPGMLSGTKWSSSVVRIQWDAKERMLFITDFANGSDSCAICFVPPPDGMPPCLCWLTYLPSIKGRGNFGAVKTNMSEEDWSFGRVWLGNGCHHHCPLKCVDLGQGPGDHLLTSSGNASGTSGCLKECLISSRCTRQRRAGHSTLLHDPAPQGQLSLLLYGGVGGAVQCEPNGDSLTWKGGDQLSFDKCRFISGMEKWNGDSHSFPEDIVSLVQKVGSNRWKAVVFPTCTWKAELLAARCWNPIWGLNKWMEKNSSKALKYKKRNCLFISSRWLWN